MQLLWHGSPGSNLKWLHLYHLVYKLQLHHLVKKGRLANLAHSGCLCSSQCPRTSLAFRLLAGELSHVSVVRAFTLAINSHAGLIRITPALLFKYFTCQLSKPTASFLHAGLNQPRSPAAGTKWEDCSQFLAQARTH